MSVPAYDHIVVAIMENHDYSEIIGNREAPYINGLAAGGASLSNYTAITHPSEPNYFALYAGSTFGVTDDNAHSEPDPTLATILHGAGKTFTGYIEPASPAKHNPWESFPEGFTVERDFSAFPTSNNFASLPSVSFVVPDQNDDMHDGTIQQGDTWLQTNIDSYAQWANTHNSLLIVVWDEGDVSPNNQMASIFYGAHVVPGSYDTAYNHYNLLSTILAAFNLTGPNNAATESAIQVFQSSTSSPILTAVTETPSSGDLNAGKMVTIALGTNEAVTVSGSPTLTLNDGETATYDAGTSTSTSLVFDYTVASTDTNVASLAVTSVDVPAGTSIVDAAGNNLDPSLSGLTQTGPQISTSSPILTAVTETPSSGASALDDRNEPLPVSSNPTHWFTAAADGTVTGTNGPDAIYATSGHATLIGNGGDDTFYVNSNDTVAGGAGVDTVVTYWGGFSLPEDVENLVATGDGAVARGNHLDNLIAGGAGQQTFFGGGGHDVFEGGADSDIFVASRADRGNVVVNDFQSGVDRVRLDGFTAFTDFTSVQNSMTQVGSDVVVDLGDGQTLTLRGHQTTDFSAADFWTGIDLSHFQLAFADEFDSFDWSPDGSHGWRTTLDWGNRTLPSNYEAQYYSDSSVGVNPFHLHDGVLDITATAGSNPLGLPYNSGVITTQGSFSQLYGYFEMRAELPSGAGLWPTFSLLPADHSWPPELDVFEVLGSDPTTAVVTVHSASTGAHTMVASAVATANLSEGFHTFGVNWTLDIIQWYIDGIEVAEAPTPADMHQPMYLLANLAVGGAGSWPGVADPSAFPATMSIDYIHVYQPLEQGAFASNSAAASVNDPHASNSLEGVTHPAIVDGFGSPMQGLLGGAPVAYHGDLII